MIRAIISDLGNVLVRFDHMRTCHALSQKSVHAPDHIHKLLFQSGLERDYDLGCISSERFAQKIMDQLNIKLELQEMQKAWEAIFWPFPGMEKLIVALKPHYRLVLLSNTNPWHFEYCFNRFPFLRLFDAFALSYNLGYRKPDPQIFKSALEEAGHAPEECLFIDDIQAYVDAAAELGIKSICFEGVDQLKSELSAHGVRFT